MNVANKQIGPPKNKKTSKVDLSLSVVQALRRLQAQRKVVSIGGNELVFPNLSYQMLIRKTVKEIAPRPIRIHDLRHTYASFGIGQGLSLAMVGKLLGHTQASTTQRYAHLADDPVREAARKVEDIIAANR